MASLVKKIGVITGSTRAVRVGPQVAELVSKIFSTQLDSKVTIHPVDIASFKLPIFDEEIIPMTIPAAGQFVHAHSKAWSEEIKKYDGYVVVTPEYNASVPGSLKNAIDYLYHEIQAKPFLIISYGTQGGVSSSASLKSILTRMKATVVETSPALSFSKNGPVEYGFPLDLRQALKGELGDLSKAEWDEGSRGEIEKGFGELKQALLV